MTHIGVPPRFCSEAERRYIALAGFENDVLRQRMKECHMSSQSAATIISSPCHVANEAKQNVVPRHFAEWLHEQHPGHSAAPGQTSLAYSVIETK